MKVVINRRFGGFSISKEAAEFMAARGNEQAKAELEENDDFYGYGYSKFFNDGYKRTDPDLVAAVEELGEKANGYSAKLKVVDIPDEIRWYIHDYDGMESIEEEHNSWY